MHVYAMFASSTKECLRMITQLTSPYDTFTYGLRMFTENIFPCAILACCRSDPETGTSRLLPAGGNWNEYTSSLSVHVDRTMILVHSEAVLNLQLVPGGKTASE
jgi:hypothetical protein